MLIEFLVRYGLKIALFLGAIGLAVNWASNVYDGIREDGAMEERAKWQQEEALAEKERNKKIIQMTEAIRNIEKEAALHLSKISSEHAKDIQNANIQKQRDIAAARSGALKLRWATEESENRNGGNASSDIARTASISHGAKKRELPAEITANLYELVDDADANTEQLEACQGVIRAYQKFRCKPYKETTDETRENSIYPEG